MASRAIWRTVPGDPRSRLGWLACEGPRWAVLVLRKMLLAIAGLALYAAFVGATPALLFALLAFAALVATIPAPSKPPPSADPSPGLSFSGTIEVFRQGVLLGDDRVAATFVDGWLHVEGFRTAFALKGDDVGGVVEIGSATVLKLTEGTELRLRLALDPPPYKREAHGVRVNYVRFDGASKRWHQGPLAAGDSVLPPDRPHPSAFARTATNLAAAILGTATTLIVFLVIGPVWGVASILLVPGPPLITAVQDSVRLRRLARKG